MKLIKMYKHLLLLLSAFSILSACETTSDTDIATGEALLNVGIEGVVFDSEDNKSASNQTQSNSTASETHIQNIDNNLHIEYQLNPAEESVSKNIKSNLSANTKLTELERGIRYKLLVYKNANKQLVASKDYRYKEENLSSAIPLDTYTEYVFVMVSEGSTSTLPTVNDESNLNEAYINTNNVGILHWISQPMKLKAGNNFLAGRLKPKYSEITVTLNLDQITEGYFTGITDPIIKPTATNLRVNVASGDVIQINRNFTEKTIKFPSLNADTRSITSEKVSIIHDTDTDAEIIFPSLTINGEKKENVKIGGLKLIPGKKYNLKINFKVCTEAVVTDKENVWDYRQKSGSTGIEIDGVHKPNGTILEKSYTMAGADYGYIFDILELDNAFNLKINGTLIYGTDPNKHEVQFERRVSGSDQNIQYADGTKYDQTDQYETDLTDIYNIKGTEKNPALRVIISQSGNVTMYGSKTSGGTLHLLKIIDGKGAFNKVTWNSGENTVIATTRVQNHTKMIYIGRGVKKIKCP